MNKTGVFLAGTLIGGLVGYLTGKKISDEKCEEQIREEVKSVKEAFRRRRSKEKKAEEKTENPETKEKREETENHVNTTGKTSWGEAPEFVKKAIDETFNEAEKEDSEAKERKMTNYRNEAKQYSGEAMKEQDEIRKMAEKLKPRVIDPADVGENEEYGDPIELNFFADGVLMDENELPMSEEEIETNLVRDFKDHFGEFEDDAVYIVNDRLKTYYVILKNNITYEKYKIGRPYLNRK